MEHLGQGANNVTWAEFCSVFDTQKRPTNAAGSRRETAQIADRVLRVFSGGCLVSIVEDSNIHFLRLFLRAKKGRGPVDHAL